MHLGFISLYIMQLDESEWAMLLQTLYIIDDIVGGSVQYNYYGRRKEKDRYICDPRHLRQSLSIIYFSILYIIMTSISDML